MGGKLNRRTSSPLLFICSLFSTPLSVPWLCCESWHYLLGRRVYEMDNSFPELLGPQILFSANKWGATTPSGIGGKMYMIIISILDMSDGVVHNTAPMCLMLLCICCGNTASIQRKQERVREGINYLTMKHCRTRTFISIYTCLLSPDCITFSRKSTTSLSCVMLVLLNLE